MKYLTVSMRHQLLPLHNRLRREGHECEALVWRPRYEKAWDGSVQKLARHSDGSLNAEVLTPAVEAAQRGELTVLTDVRRVAELFHAAPKLFHTLDGLPVPQPNDHLMFGGWFDGEAIQAQHLLVADRGTWTGGLGPNTLGGLTLVRLRVGGVGGYSESHFAREATQVAADLLKRAGFRGLFHFTVEEVPTTGELKLAGLAVGWPWLHTQVFTDQLASLSDVLGGAAPQLGARFVVGVPISLPPWPNERQGAGAEGIPVEGLTSQQRERIMWHDIVVDTEARKLRTAGVDGLLGVALGASNSTPALARSRALELCSRLQVPELQYRPDAGQLTDAALSTLEDRWGFEV